MYLNDPATVWPGAGAGAGCGVGLTGRGLGAGLGTELPVGRAGLGTEGGAGVGLGGADNAKAAVPAASTAVDFCRAERRDEDDFALMLSWLRW
ncbi:MAG: hypothetical protein ACOVRM_18955 [Planctomycetaceae bacterium]